MAGVGAVLAHRKIGTHGSQRLERKQHGWEKGQHGAGAWNGAFKTLGKGEIW
jgi:hypothetical protein